MPIAAAASNALKSQKAKANQQETKTKAGADPELLNFLSDQNPSKLGPKTNRLHFNRTKFQGLFGIIFLFGFYFDTISYLVHIREHSASGELGQRVQSAESKKETAAEAAMRSLGQETQLTRKVSIVAITKYIFTSFTCMPLNLNLNVQHFSAQKSFFFNMFDVLEINLCVHLDLVVSPRRITVSLNFFSLDHQVPVMDGP